MNLRFLWALLAAMWLVGIAPAAEIIQKGKAINITVKGVPTAERIVINGVYPISEEGLLNMPYVGRVAAAGLSPEELERVLKGEFVKKEIYQNAKFQVLSGIVDAWPKSEFTVGGRVKKPGPVPFFNGMTLWQAIQAAGEKDQYADLRRVNLFRGGKKQTYNMKDLESREVPLRLNDTVEVPGVAINDPSIPWRSP
jgi:protein involved in polysaccharide export with SLBB domain